MFISKNPATEEILKEYAGLSDAEIEVRLSKASDAQKEWKKKTFAERAAVLKKLAAIFREEKETVGKIIALEMGRPLTAAIAESEKCAWVAEYYADNAEAMLSPEPFPDGLEGEVRFEPLGVIYAVMPWNYPFWQVMRFAAPALMAGNVGLLKHASNVPQAAEMLEKMFLTAGFPEGVFQNLFISIEQSNSVIADARVAAVTLTGSVRAGVGIGGEAGKNLKKVVLELGGSDPFIVLSDADIAKAAEVGALSRLQNAGQTCIAAKRFLVEESVYEDFLARLKEEFKKYVPADPMNPATSIGPVAAEHILKGVAEQVEKSVALGATLETGGKRPEGKGLFYVPTILTGVKKGMPAYDEEIFGPVASVIKVKDEDEAVAIANDTVFGLSSSVWSKDIERAKKVAARIEAGGVFINAMTKSDPRIPFGGIKESGHGRELGKWGIREFVNVKTVSITRPS
jgi:succinate-semialdehyde dehydrogenase/glutarate-semialdehyde dehydrogenase